MGAAEKGKSDVPSAGIAPEKHLRRTGCGTAVRSAVRVALTAAMFVTAPGAPAQGLPPVPLAPPPAAAPAATDANVLPALKPGEFVWFEPPAAIAAAMQARGETLSITVAREPQLAYVYRGDRLVGFTTVSTGAPGRRTPLGEFTILEKRVFHRSNLYSNAPMPFMQRLTWGGIALHAGVLPGYPASHGCIRLPRAFAEQLYALTRIGGHVSIVDSHFDLPPLPEPVRPLAVTPRLEPETRNLGNGAFDVLTHAGDPPPERPLPELPPR